jgi:hypothetical protein
MLTLPTPRCRVLPSFASLELSTVRTDPFARQDYLSGSIPELLTNASRLLSGDQEGTFIVPCPPYT